MGWSEDPYANWTDAAWTPSAITEDLTLYAVYHSCTASDHSTFNERCEATHTLVGDIQPMGQSLLDLDLAIKPPLASAYTPTADEYTPVTAIADGAFYGEPVTVVTLPASVRNVTAATFAGAEKLTSILAPGNCENYASRRGLLFSADRSTLVCCPPGRRLTAYTVPNGVTAIGDNAFAD